MPGVGREDENIEARTAVFLPGAMNKTDEDNEPYIEFEKQFCATIFLIKSPPAVDVRDTRTVEARLIGTR